MSYIQTSVVYYTYLDENGKPCADKVEMNINSDSDTLEMETLEYVETMIGQIKPHQKDILIMLMENR